MPVNWLPSLRGTAVPTRSLSPLSAVAATAATSAPTSTLASPVSPRPMSSCRLFERRNAVCLDTPPPVIARLAVPRVDGESRRRHSIATGGGDAALVARLQLPQPLAAQQPVLHRRPSHRRGFSLPTTTSTTRTILPVVSQPRQPSPTSSAAAAAAAAVAVVSNYSSPLSRSRRSSTSSTTSFDNTSLAAVAINRSLTPSPSSIGAGTVHSASRHYRAQIMATVAEEEEAEEAEGPAGPEVDLSEADNIEDNTETDLHQRCPRLQQRRHAVSLASGISGRPYDQSHDLPWFLSPSTHGDDGRAPIDVDTFLQRESDMIVSRPRQRRNAICLNSTERLQLFTYLFASIHHHHQAA